MNFLYEGEKGFTPSASISGLSSQNLLTSWASLMSKTQIKTDFEYGIRYGLYDSKELTSLLKSGWSWPEPTLIWSDGPFSVLRIPRNGHTEQRFLICELRGFCIDGEIAITASINAVVLTSILKTAVEDRGVNLDIGFLLPANQDYVDIVLSFNQTTVGSGLDQRQLALAVQSILVYEDRTHGEFGNEPLSNDEMSSAEKCVIEAAPGQLPVVSQAIEILDELVDRIATATRVRMTNPLTVAYASQSEDGFSFISCFRNGSWEDIVPIGFALERLVHLSMEQGLVLDLVVSVGDEPAAFAAVFNEARNHDAFKQTVWCSSSADLQILERQFSGDHLGEYLVYHIDKYIIFQPNTDKEDNNFTSYATVLSQFSKERWSFHLSGRSIPNARTIPTIKMLKEIISSNNQNVKDGDFFLTQYDDYCHRHFTSIGYGRPQQCAEMVELIPDTYFFFSDGYATLRTMSERGELPAWKDRENTFFWRGSPTYAHRHPDGTLLQSVAEIPRVAFCERATRIPHCDVGIFSSWGDLFQHDVMRTYLENKKIYKERIPMAQHSRYRFLFDLDGVSNAWGLVERLLIGSCILKVESRYEQWFYDRLKPWKHFVPVAADLSDLEIKVQWCLDHDDEARMIGEEARRLGLELTPQSTLVQTQAAIEKVTLPRA